jgi:hypothetical protein
MAFIGFGAASHNHLSQYVKLVLQDRKLTFPFLFLSFLTTHTPLQTPTAS